MTKLRADHSVRFMAIAITGLTLSGCATAYGNRSDEIESPLRELAIMTGMATDVPAPEEFVEESRPETLNYIPIGVRPQSPDGQGKVLTPEELLLLKQKLEAAQQQNTGISPIE